MTSRAASGIATDTAALHALLQPLAADEVFFWLASAVRLHDLQRGVPDVAALDEFDEGRAFSPTCEIRWRREGAAWRVLWLGEAEVPAGLAPLPFSLRAEDRRQALVGEQRGKGWSDTRMPRVLTYPEAVGEHPWVKTRQYVDQASGRILYSRWVSLGGNRA